MKNDKIRAKLIKDLYGKPDISVRKQLYNIVKDDKDFKERLKRMKVLFKSL